MNRYLIILNVFTISLFIFWVSCEESTETDSTPPTVSIQSPVTGQTVGEIVTITVTTQDNSGIEKVEFFIDDSLQFTDTKKPYQYEWNTEQYENGSEHVIRVTSYDTSENFTESQPVPVVVDNTNSYPTKIELNHIHYQDGSFIISWSKSPDEDFSYYKLFESFSEDMNNESVTFESANKNDTTTVVSDVLETRYYRLVVSDIYGFETASSVAPAIPLPSENLIVYPETDNNQHLFEIYLMNYETLEKQVLTEGILPVWNKDGSSVLFLNNKNLYSINVNGQNLTQLIYNEYLDYFISGTQMHLSPNGEKLVLNLYDGDYFQIATINTDGTGQQYLTNNSFDNLYPEWSPDGTKIKFISDRLGEPSQHQMNIYVINSDGTNEIQLTDNVGTWQITNSTWSIDGSKIYYLWYDDGFDLMEIDLGVGTPTFIASVNLTGSRDSFSTFQLSPDGQYIYFRSENSLYRIDIDGNNQIQLVGEDDGYEIGYIYGIDFSVEDKIVISIGKNLLMVNDDGTNPMYLTNNEDPNIQPRYPRFQQ